METLQYTRQKFYDLIWETPLSQLAQKFAISDNGLRKLCKKHQVPIPANDYWQKIRFNKPVKRERMPALDNDDLKIELHLRPEGSVINLDASPETVLARQIESAPNAPLIVPNELLHPHKLTKETKRHWADRNKHKRDHNYDKTIPHLSIYVEEPTRPRALLFFDSLIKLLEYRGHKVSTRENATFVIIRGVEFDLSLRESSNRVFNTQGRWRTSELIPNGKLHLKTGQHSWDKQWLENKKGLDSMLAKIAARLELDADKELKWREDCRLSAIRREEEEKIRREKEALRKAEQEKLDKLLQESSNYEKAQQIRQYINAVKKKAEALGVISEEHKNWVIWANQNADSYDPLMQSDQG